jgi:CubicO group peptidase (beta-lactamase class C family)
MRIKLAVSAFLFALLLSAAAVADHLPTATPESVGLSSERLGRISEVLKADIAKGVIPGAVLLVSRHGKIAHFEALGNLDPQAKTLMGKDAIFRIYSMTKPITSVCIMMLFEEGKLALSDPVAKYIPEFKDVQVGEEKRDADGKVTLELVAAKRPITIQDLLRHTSGLTYSFFGEGAVKNVYKQADIYRDDPDNKEFAERLAKLPLVYQPGTTWEYSHSTDVLGRIVEVASGKSLHQYMKDTLFDPLEMSDTAFYVADSAKHARLAEPFANDRSFGPGLPFSDPRLKTRQELGGHGLMSTAMDYARFAQMLINGGTLDGRRYLGPRTIAYMTSDHMGEVKRSPYEIIGPGHKFGLGFVVRTESGVATFAGSPGDYAWSGAAGTTFWVDPKEKLFVVFMIQTISKRAIYRPLLRNMVYAAIVE